LSRYVIIFFNTSQNSQRKSFSLVSSSFASFLVIDSSAGSWPKLSSPDLTNYSARNPGLVQGFSLVSGAEQKIFPRARCLKKGFSLVLGAEKGFCEARAAPENFSISHFRLLLPLAPPIGVPELTDRIRLETWVRNFFENLGHRPVERSEVSMKSNLRVHHGSIGRNVSASHRCVKGMMTSYNKTNNGKMITHMMKLFAAFRHVRWENFDFICCGIGVDISQMCSRKDVNRT
jgi:hypothetical protein